jgi:hypothetical protein
MKNKKIGNEKGNKKKKKPACASLCHRVGVSRRFSL